jgi:DNA primase large subunit
MSHLHTSMRQNHHLRHGGRQQYGLFLKGIGLSLEEAIKFWRSEFTKLIDVDKVTKTSVLKLKLSHVISWYKTPLYMLPGLFL